MMQNIVAGALFDFLGFLTTLGEPVVMGSGHDAKRPCDLLAEWAARRGLDIDEADVTGWRKEIE